VDRAPTRAQYDALPVSEFRVKTERVLQLKDGARSKMRIVNEKGNWRIGGGDADRAVFAFAKDVGNPVV
jgi:hypothetical protein